MVPVGTPSKKSVIEAPTTRWCQHSFLDFQGVTEVVKLAARATENLQVLPLK